MAMYQHTKKRVALQLLHFGLHWMPSAEIRDYEEIPLSYFSADIGIRGAELKLYRQLFDLHHCLDEFLRSEVGSIVDACLVGINRIDGIV